MPTAAPVEKQLLKSSVVAFAKADAAKRIVTGVVLDPYAVDLQTDWSPPNEVEKTAHDWLARWSMLGADHTLRLKGAEVVESYLFPYPTQDDYAKACALQPHAVWEMPLGDDVLHSGAWVLSVRLTPEQWQQVLDGTFSAFSIRGYGERTPVDARVMPEVQVWRISPPTNGVA